MRVGKKITALSFFLNVVTLHFGSVHSYVPVFHSMQVSLAIIIIVFIISLNYLFIYFLSSFSHRCHSLLRRKTEPHSLTFRDADRVIKKSYF